MQSYFTGFFDFLTLCADIDEFYKLCQVFYGILKYLKDAFIAMDNRPLESFFKMMTNETGQLRAKWSVEEFRELGSVRFGQGTHGQIMNLKDYKYAGYRDVISP